MKKKSVESRLLCYLHYHNGAADTKDILQAGFNSSNLTTLHKKKLITSPRSGRWMLVQTLVGSDFKAAERTVVEQSLSGPVVAPNPVTELVQLAMQTGIQMEKMNQMLLKGRAAQPDMDHVMALLKGHSP